MEPLNRTVLVVTPKRRFLEWANALPDAGEPLKREELESLRGAYLIDSGDVPPDLQDLIDEYSGEIFEAFLNGWVIDESLWPANRTPHTFRDWFSVDWIESVTDADPHRPITVHELARTHCATCDAELGDSCIGIAVNEDRTWRLSAAELAERDEMIEAGDTPPVELTFLFRCCGEACAAQVEQELVSAAGDRAESES